MLQINDSIVEKLWRAVEGEEGAATVRAARRFATFMECYYERVREPVRIGGPAGSGASEAIPDSACSHP